MHEPRTGLCGDERPIFQFSYRSMPFQVHLRSTEAGTIGMLEAMIGILPYTGDGDSLRRNMLALIGDARRATEYGIDIGRDHRINLSVALPVDGSSSADAILAAAMERLAAAKKFLDMVVSLQPPHLRKLTAGVSWTAA